MNQKEAAAVAEVLDRLRRGPRGSWHETIAGRQGPYVAPDLERFERFDLWFDTWIAPTLERVVDRYGTDNAKALASRSKR